MKRFVCVLVLLIAASVAYAQDSGISVGPTFGYPSLNVIKTGTVYGISFTATGSIDLLTAGVLFDAKYFQAKISYAGQIGPTNTNSTVGSATTTTTTDTGYSYLSVGMNFKVPIPIGKIFSLNPIIGLSYDQFIASNLNLSDAAKESLSELFGLAGIGCDVVIHPNISIGIYGDFGFDFVSFSKDTNTFPYKIDTLLVCNFRF